MSRVFSPRRLVALGVFGLLALAVIVFLWVRGGGHSDTQEITSGRHRPGDRRVREVPVQPDVSSARVTGDVHLGASGEPGTARVCATPRTPSGPLLTRSTCTTLGANGYTLQLRPGVYRISASAPGHLPAARDVTLAADDLEVNLALVSGGVAIRGRVLDLAGGVIDGAFVRAGEGFAVSDEAGRFELWTRAGETTVTAWSPGYVPARTTQWAPVDALELHLLMASSISGRVRGLDGAPATGVEVSVLDGAVANTDDRGEFRLTPLPPGRYSVVARADGARGRAEHSVLLGLGEHAGGVEIRLRAATRLRAVIVDEEDHPLCLSGQVQLSPSAPGIDDLESGISLVSEAEFLVAPPGQYYAHVRCDEPSVAFSVPGVEVERESQTLRWSAPSGAGVRGCVVRDGERLAGAGVTLDGVEEDPPVHRVARLDAGGCFAFTRVPPGRYRVGPDPYGEQTATILDRRFALERRDVELTLELADTATLWGGMVDQDGAPLVGYTIVVELRGARRAKLERVTTAGGEFRFDVVPTGALQVAVRDRDGRDVALAGAFAGAPALTIGDGEARALNLSLARGVGRISGSVRDSGGAELSDVFVTAVREDEERGLMSGSDSNLLGVAGGRTVLCDVDGSFALENLSEGTYRVLAFERGGREVSRAGVAIGSSVELVLEDEASVRGSVTLPGGDAPERFELIARASSGVGVSEVFEGTEGRWFLEGLNEGKYEVSATADGGFAALARVATEAGEVTTLELELAAPATISGRLVDASTGKPVAGVKVWAGSSLVLSDEQGAFRLEEVPVTEMSLFAWNGHGAEHRLARRRLTLASGEYVELGVIELSRVGAR